MLILLFHRPILQITIIPTKIYEQIAINRVDRFTKNVDFKIPGAENILDTVPVTIKSGYWIEA